MMHSVHCLYFEMVSSIIYLAKMDKVINSNTKTIAIARLEVVASVDGLDVIDGRAASRSNSGLCASSTGELIVEGFQE